MNSGWSLVGKVGAVHVLHHHYIIHLPEEEGTARVPEVTEFVKGDFDLHYNAVHLDGRGKLIETWQDHTHQGLVCQVRIREMMSFGVE